MMTLWRRTDRTTTERQKGLATILGPDGNIVAGPLEAGEGILYADVCPNDVVICKYGIDIAGHYNRPELFVHRFEKYFGKSRL